MVQEMACIICPMSCHLTIETNEEGEVTSVSGNNCKRGDAYARSELTNPVRMVTGTVRLEHGLYPRLPVTLSGMIPKSMIFPVMEEIHKVNMVAPIKIHDIIIENVCGLPVNVIASRSVKKID